MWLSDKWDSLFLRGIKVVRGCQKKIVYLKSTGSDVFTDAYFVVRDNALEGMDERDMIKEANRILDECISIEDGISKRQIIISFIKKNAIPFLAGIVSGVIITILIN